MATTIKLSPIVAGCMNWGQWGARFIKNDYKNSISACIDHAITSFDHADIYGSYTTEQEFGEALHELQGYRQKLQLITKCGIKLISPNRPAHSIKSYDTSKEYIINCVEKSLSNLQTDYIDVLLIHRPSPLMDPTEMAEAFTQLKIQGKVLHVGVSNFTPSQVSMLHHFFPVEVNQLELSIREMSPFHNGQLDQCLEKKIIPMAWSPLGGGSIFTGTDEKNKKIVTIATALSANYKTSVENILLAFLHKHPAGILPVLGTTKIERLKDAIKSTSIELTTEDWFVLWEASSGNEVP